MNTEVAIPQTFEQKMKNRIRDSIGDLITDEELKKMIDRSMEELFFKKRPNPKYSSYSRNNEPEQLDPFMYELVKELLQPTVNKHIQEYIKEHPEEIIAAVKETCSLGIGQAVLSAFNVSFQGQLNSFQTNMIYQMQNIK